MKYVTFVGLLAVMLLVSVSGAFADDIELAQKSTIEDILKRGELLVGLEAGYLPFENGRQKRGFHRVRRGHRQRNGEGDGREINHREHVV